MQYKFKTSFPFPILKINTEINYTPVEKPTGISYFLLVLINESKNKKDNISYILEQFGVPKILHQIFAEEIINLINKKIIYFKSGEYNKHAFHEYIINNFAFTDKGKKVFAEEVIPLNMDTNIKQSFWYIPFKNQIELNIPSSWKVGNIESSILGKEFYEQFKYNDIIGLEDFANKYKGNGIKIKKQEIITDINLLKPEHFFTTLNINLEVDEKANLQIDFEDKTILDFFKKNYSKRQFEDALHIKKKFKFSGPNVNNLDINNISNIDDILIPEDYQKELSRNDSLSISKSNYKVTNSKLEYESSDLINQVNSNIEVIKFYNNKAIGYIPASIKLQNNCFKEDVFLYFLICVKLTEQEINTIVVPLVEELQEFSIENFKKVYAISKIRNDNSLLTSTIDSYLKTGIETGIVRLKEIRDVINNNPIVYSFYQKRANELYEEYIRTVNSNNILSKLDISLWIPKMNKKADVDILSDYLKNINIKNKIKLFELLESKFKLDDLLVFINPIPDYFESKDNNDGKLGLLISNLTSSCNEIINITGIKDPYNYKLRDDIKSDIFISSYKVFKLSLEKMTKYYDYDVEHFSFYSNLYKIYSILNNLFIEEKKSISDVKAITKKYIDKKIEAGDYINVLVSLSKKLEYILHNKFNFKGTLSEMLNEALNKKIIKKDVVLKLHNFRDLRNIIVHANNNAISYTNKDLFEYSNIIFELSEVKNNESTSDS